MGTSIQKHYYHPSSVVVRTCLHMKIIAAAVHDENSSSRGWQMHWVAGQRKYIYDMRSLLAVVFAIDKAGSLVDWAVYSVTARCF